MTVRATKARDDGPPAATASGRTTTINLRASPQQKALIDRAAAIAGKSRTEFMLDCARQAAEQTIFDQRRIVMSDEQFSEFVRILDNPPPPSAELIRLMATKPPWQE